MAQRQEVIEGELIDDKGDHDKDESPADVIRNASERLANSFDRLGYDRAASKARTVGELTGAAQQTYEQVKPAVGVIGRFFSMLEDRGIKFENNRPPFRRR